MAARQIHYEGVTRQGVNQSGTLSARHLTRWIEHRYNRGWRELTVTDGDVVVGRIETGDGSNRGGWWAESGPAAAMKPDLGHEADPA